ncbi:MAG: recombination regulator RecX [Candidatus Omnitrophica bacterium]|nr:recombination regulator RecX [Candidatus Omnitrophota bacterium]MCM8798126.1 recombination regulator RecX [Candidatus Omnitrophota bacterium]
MDELAKAKNYALRILKYRPRTKKEILERLKKKKYSPDLIERVMQEMSEAGLVNDKEFVKFWVNWRREVNPRSKNFISWELKEKGIPEELIEEGLEGISKEDDFGQAEQLAKKQFVRLKNIAPEKAKRRLYGYLQRRGFSQEIIFEVISRLFSL